MVRGVRWLGASARVASFSSERTAHGFRNALLLTDARSRASLPFRDVGVEAAPMLGIRAAPSGRYLLLLLRSAPSEIWAVRAWPALPPTYLPASGVDGKALVASCLPGTGQNITSPRSAPFVVGWLWQRPKESNPASAGAHPRSGPAKRGHGVCAGACGQQKRCMKALLPRATPFSRPCRPPHACVQVGGEARPARIRVLDLPFTAVEWVLPREAASRIPPGAERWLTLQRSPLARERSFFGAWDLDGGDAPTEGAPTRTSPHQLPAHRSGATVTQRLPDSGAGTSRALP